jgi:hypothetical protein
VATALATAVVVATWQDARLTLQPDRWFVRESHRAAQWCSDHLPATARIGMTDCGAMGYFCEQPVVNLDGYANSFEYLQDYLKPGRVPQYLASEGITYFAQHKLRIEKSPESIGRRVIEGEPYAADSVRVLGGRSAHLLTSRNEVYHGRPYSDGPTRGVFAIWDLRRAE